MYLTKEEERMLSGEYGSAVQKALEVLVRVGEALGAERLVPISHAHVSGISYVNIGDEGLEFIKELAEDARVRVFATYNPLAVPLNVDCMNEGSEQQEDRVIVSKQQEIVNCLHKMGFRPSATCIPYLMRPPKRGEHLAWGESSAVTVANSLFEGRTNREGGPLALLAAIAGRTYYWGMHLDEFRKARVTVEAPMPRNELEAGLLGYLIAKLGEQVVELKLVGDSLPFTYGMQLCAAAGAWGNVAMIKLSRDVKYRKSRLTEGLGREVIHVDHEDIAKALEEASTAHEEEGEVFYAGCPHLTPEEVLAIVRFVLSKGIRLQRRELWLSLPGYLLYEDRGLWLYLARRLRERGVRLLFGTCIIVSTIARNLKVVITNSLKAAFYLPRLRKIRIALSPLWSWLKEVARS